MNPAVKELFELQDKHELLKEELQRKDAELNELQEFTAFEREAEAEMIKDLKEKTKALEANLPWLEEELMKTQQERNILRQKLETKNLQLTAVEDGSGMTEKSRKLSETETKVGDLSSELEIQKSRYEFHIEQMKKKLETYTGLLEEKGVDSEFIKQRLFSDGVQNEEISELQSKHEQEINELRNEVDLLVLGLEKEKSKVSEICEQYELEFEDQKMQYQKDKDEAREEIEIYQQLLKEEKAKNESKYTGEDLDEETELSELKERYETELKQLRNEISKYVGSVENRRVSESDTAGQTQDDSKIELDHEGQIYAIKETYESEVAKIKEELENNVEALEEERGKVSEIQKDMRETKEEIEIYQQLLGDEISKTDNVEYVRAVAVRLKSDLVSQKEKYVEEINNLKKEIVKYAAIVESINTIDSADIQQRNDLEKDKYEQQIATLKENYENEISKLKNILDSCKAGDIVEVEQTSDDNEKKGKREIAKLMEEIIIHVKALEEEREKMSAIQKDLEDAKEEIGIYHQLLEEEKSKNASQDDGKGSETLVETSKLKADLKAQEESYEAELSELRNEVHKYKDIVKSQKMDISTEDETNTDLEMLRMKYEGEINKLKNELSKYTNIVENLKSVNTGNVKDRMDMENVEYEQQIATLKENYEQQETLKLNEKLNSSLNTSEEEKVVVTDVCRIGKIKKQVNFDINSEIELQREKYELQIKELSEERDAYQTILDENESSGSERNQFDFLKRKHDKQMETLKNELARYVEFYEKEMAKQASKTDGEVVMKESCIQNCEGQLERMKETILNKETGENLQTEMLRAEIDTLKAKHEEEVEELKAEVRTYLELLEQEKNKNTSVENDRDTRSEMTMVEIEKFSKTQRELESMDQENMKKIYEEKIRELQEEIKINMELFEEERLKNEKMHKKDLDSREGAESGDLMELDSKELVESEIENINMKYSAEIERLGSEVMMYIEMYESEKAKNEENRKAAEGCESNDELKQIEEKHTEEIENMKEEFKKFIEENFHNSSQTNEEKDNYEKEIENLKSELNSYIELYEVEKVKTNTGTDNENSGNADLDLRANLLVKELETLKIKHHAEMEEMKMELNTLKELLESRKSENISQIDKLKNEVEQMEANYKQEIEDLKQERETYVKQISEYSDMFEEQEKLKNLVSEATPGHSDLQTEMLKEEIVSLKEKHKEEVDELQKQISEYSEMLVEQEKVRNLVSEDTSGHADLQTEMLKAEIANLKKQQEEEVDGLQKQIVEYSEMLEQEKLKNFVSEDTTGNSDLQTEILKAEIASLKEKHEEEIDELQKQIVEYSEMLVEQEKVKNLVSEETPGNADLQTETLKAEIASLKEKHEEEIDELQKQIAEYSEMLVEQEKVRNLVSEDTSGHADLQTETLKAEIASLKEKHEEEIDELQKQIAEYSEMLVEQEKVKNLVSEDTTMQSDLQTEMLKAEIASMKEKHEEEVDQLQKQIAEYSEMLIEQEKQKKSYSVDSTENSDLQTEMLKAEIASLKEKHEEELDELHKQVKKYSEMLEVENLKQPDSSEISESEPSDVGSLRKELDTCLMLLKEERAQQAEEQDTFNQHREVYESTIDEMQDEMKQVHVELQTLSTDIEKLQEANRTLKREKLDLINSKMDAEQKTENLEETVREIQDEIKLLEEEGGLLKSRISDLEEHIHIGKGMLAIKDEDIETLKLSLEEQIETMDKEIANKTAEIREQCTKLEEKLLTQEDEIRCTNERLVELEISENQFSDKIVTLESEIETHREKEADLNKLCSEYEEKIVILESDLDMIKSKSVELEEICTDQEKHIEGLQLDLDIAQNKDSELKDIQQTYQEKISGLEEQLKQALCRASEIDTVKCNLEKKLSLMEIELEAFNEKVVVMGDEREATEGKLKDLLETANKERENLKTQLQEMEEKLEVYSETVTDLQDEIRQSEKETESLKSRAADLEEEVRKGRDAISENTFLKERVETLESDGRLSAELIAEYETEVQGLRDQVTSQESSRAKEEEIAHMRLEFDDQLKVIQTERESLISDLKVLRVAKDQAEKLAETLQEEKNSLQEDIFQLERNLHPQAIKYHSLPENIEWENKWKEFSREEKKKRVVLYSQIRSLKQNLQFEKERSENAAEEALQPKPSRI